jgi:hypothetical protein
MKDVYEILRQKEMDIVRVRKEIEALLSVIPLLADETEQPRGASRAFSPEPERKLAPTAAGRVARY